MNIINSLTLRHLRQNKGRTLITIIGIVLSVAMVCCVAGFVLSLRDLGISMIKENKGDYHIIYMDVLLETAGQIADEDVFSSHYIKESATDGYVNIHLRMKQPKRDIIEVAGAIAEKYGVERWGGNTELLALEGVIPYDNVMTTVIIIAGIAITVIVAGSVIVIANAFNISASERVRQFGLLKSVGATSAQLTQSIFFEAIILTAIAIPVGIALGFLIQAIVLWLANGLFAEIFALNMQSGTLAFRVVFDPLVIYVSIAIALITALITAWLPARRAAGTSAIDAIRQTKDIQIRSANLKSSRLTQLLFGFEGTLAAKSLKRSNGKYRATVVSLTMSIILFVSMSSFIWTMNTGVEMEYGGYNFDVLAYVKGGIDSSYITGELLRSIPDAKVNTMRRTFFYTTVPDGFVSENNPENADIDNGYGLLLLPMPDAEFYALQPDMDGGIPGILVNTAIATRDNKRIESPPFNCEVGVELPLIVEASDGNITNLGGVTISKIVNRIPDIVPGALFDSRLINVFIPESIYVKLLSENETVLKPKTETYYTVSAANPDAFTESAMELFAQYPAADDESRIIQNISQMTRLNRNITLAFMLFGHGFIAMLSLIAVTSVVATISTGMTLRRQEFAMLFSVGMTSEGMNKMLNLESLLYGLKSLLIGLPVGVLLSVLIHKSMANTLVFAYSPPINAMIISIVAVMVLTFGTMRYGKRKLNKISIIEAIQNETV